VTASRLLTMLILASMVTATAGEPPRSVCRCFYERVSPNLIQIRGRPEDVRKFAYAFQDEIWPNWRNASFSDSIRRRLDATGGGCHLWLGTEKNRSAFRKASRKCWIVEIGEI